MNQKDYLKMDYAERSLYDAQQISLARQTLISQVGDTRECPHCGKFYIPNDVTSRLALEAYKKLTPNGQS